MTLFWLVAASLTAITVAALVWPLWRRPTPFPDRSAHDLEVYRDQLSELERDLERGLIDAGQADTARTEISRRILAIAPPPSTPPTSSDPAPPPPTRKRRVALALLVLVPLTAWSLYLAVGRPDLPAQPRAARSNPPLADGMPANIVEAVSKLAERLKREPADLEGWALLGQSHTKLNRPTEAVEAWRHALALSKDDSDLQRSLANALINANQGLVLDEARQLFEAVLAQHPGDPQASYFLALGRAQGGDFRGALDRWTALAAASPANAPWLPMVHRAIADMATRFGLDPVKAIPPSLPPQSQPDEATPTSPAASGPSSAAAAAMPTDPEERARMIRSMVDRLAARLATSPNDIAGWLRLARAYQVLKETDHQLDAISHALAQAPDRPDILVAYAEALMAKTPSAPGARLPPDAVKALKAALGVAADTPEALWFLGIDAAAAGQPTAARALWQRLLAELDPSSPDYTEVKTRLDGLQ